MRATVRFEPHYETKKHVDSCEVVARLSPSMDDAVIESR